MRNLNIDLETFSTVSLQKCGLHRYAESPDFEILLFGYSVDGGPVTTIDLACGEKIPGEVLDALTDDQVTKWAFNAQFERICLSRYLSDLGVSLDPFHDHHPLSVASAKYLDPGAWRCTMVWSAYMGLPLSLEGVGAVLGLEKQKLTEGKDLIRYFSIPCKPTKANGGRTRNLPKHDPEKWARYKAYNIRDVETEMQIQKKLSGYPVPEEVWDEYHIDQEINDRGIRIDTTLVRQAIALDGITRSKLTEAMKRLTALDNPNSVVQMKGWLSDNGIEAETLGKKAVATLIGETEGDVSAALSLRLQLAKSSVKKYQAMENAACSDGRCRGMFQFYGANRTGRFSGRLVQLQNLPQNHMEDLAEARKLVRSGNFEALDMLYDDIPDMLSQLIRTAFVPSDGMRFYVADFSAIEARVIAWLAGEEWRTQLFKAGGDIYCQSASEMFGVPVVKHGVNGHLRQKGKIAELACIAEGQLVLTDQGLVPIENVTTDHLLWDGESWVKHDGVIYKGTREVITYEGLTATTDHRVWVQGESGPIRFGNAAVIGAHLIQTGNGTNPVRLCGEQRSMVTTEKCVPEKRMARVYDIHNAGRYHRFTVSDCLAHNCGYGGSVGALKAMGALEMGLQEEELKPLVVAWRESNPNIVRFWWDVDTAVKKAIRDKTVQQVRNMEFSCQSGMLFIRLPSGRILSYAKPKMGTNQFGGEAVTYEGIGSTKKWERIESYGPKFVENIVQGTARDVLMYAMKTLRNCRIVAHVHDELIIEADPGTSLEEICEQMSRVPPWAEGLVLRADGYICDYYKKD